MIMDSNPPIILDTKLIFMGGFYNYLSYGNRWKSEGKPPIIPLLFVHFINLQWKNAG